MAYVSGWWKRPLRAHLSPSDPTGLDSLVPKPFLRAYRQRPYFYHRFLRRRPLFRFQSPSTWLASGHAECDQILRDPRFSTAPLSRWLALVPLPFPADVVARLQEAMDRMWLFSEGPARLQARHAAQSLIPVARDGALARRVAVVADELLASMRKHPLPDLLVDYAFPLVERILLDTLGVPSAERTVLARLAEEAVPFLDHVALPERMRTSADALDALMERLRKVLPHAGRDGLLQRMSRLPVPDAEGHAVANAAFILTAGHVTTANLIANSVHQLLREPKIRTRLGSDPSLWPRAVAELGRREAPVHLTGRVATSDANIGGQPIKTGETVLLLLGAAQRDPRRFPHPDRFAWDRPESANLLFGAGGHYCLGAPLAKVVVEVAIRRLLETYPDLALPRGFRPQWRASPTIRGLEGLPATLGRRASMPLPVLVTPR